MLEWQVVFMNGENMLSLILYPDTCLKTISCCYQSWQFCQIDLVCMMRKSHYPGYILIWQKMKMSLRGVKGRLLTSSAMKVKKFCMWTVWTYFHFLDTRTQFSKRNSQHAMTFLCWSRLRITFGQTEISLSWRLNLASARVFTLLECSPRTFELLIQLITYINYNMNSRPGRYL